MPPSLVTGGAGFIGSHVADGLIAMGHDTIVLDDLSGVFRDNVNPKAAFVEGIHSHRTVLGLVFDISRYLTAQTKRRLATNYTNGTN